MKNYIFEVFDYYLWLVGFHFHSDVKAIHELNSLYEIFETKKDFYEDVEMPLEKEIKINLVNTHPLEGKISLLRYYLFEQRNLQYFFKEFESLTLNQSVYHSDDGIYIINKNNNNAKIGFTSEQVYAVRCMESVDSFVQILVRECEKYNLKYETIYEGFEIIPNGNFNPKKGREFDFDINNTKQWYNELKESKEYQRDSGEPYVKLITAEIIKRHFKVTGSKPSANTIKYHRQQLGLTRQE